MDFYLFLVDRGRTTGHYNKEQLASSSWILVKHHRFSKLRTNSIGLRLGREGRHCSTQETRSFIQGTPAR